MAEELDLQQGTNDSTEAFIPEEISELLEGIPKDKREMIERIMISQISMVGRVSPEAGLVKKITGDHITKMLEMQEKTMTNSYRENHEKRWFLFGAVILAIATLIALVVLLKDLPEMMEKIITIALSAILGAAGGYGLGFHNGKGDE